MIEGQEEVVTLFLKATSTMSPREIARATGINHFTVRKLRRGEVGKSHPETIRKMMVFLNGQRRQETVANDRLTNEEVTVEAARAALEALTDVNARVEELLEFWRARMEMARSKAIPDAAAARREAGKSDLLLYEGAKARQTAPDPKKVRRSSGDRKRS